MQDILRVSLFGNFMISQPTPEGCRTLLEEDFHSPSLVVLLAYLVQHRAQPVSCQALIELLWPEEEIENPLGTLKNLVYRLRAVLRNLDPEEKYIITGKRSYGWNPEIPVELDTELFSQAYERYQTAEGADKIAACRDALELSTDHFLSRHSSVYWVISTSIQYDNQIKELLSADCEQLAADQDFQGMEVAASKAILFDNLDELFHSYLVRALIGQGRLQKALDHYHMAEELLFESLDMEVTETLQSLWPQLMEQTQSKKKDIKEVQQDLMDDYEKGAFFCEYGTFKKIYQLEIRRADRMGVSVYISLMTIGFVPVKPMDLEKKNKKIQKAMENLKSVLLTSLRSGDVITRYSKSQFIILLPTCQYETTKKVMNRIERIYNQRFSNDLLKLEYNFDSI